MPQQRAFETTLFRLIYGEISMKIVYHIYVITFSVCVSVVLYKYCFINAHFVWFVDTQYALFQRWNETYLHFHKVDPKQTYYLSMEYLQGRALTNAIGNLGITDAYADALKKFGHELEEIVEQVPNN